VKEPRTEDAKKPKKAQKSIIKKAPNLLRRIGAFFVIYIIQQQSKGSNKSP
jgi:hypothetical protein